MPFKWLFDVIRPRVSPVPVDINATAVANLKAKLQDKEKELAELQKKADGWRSETVRVSRNDYSEDGGRKPTKAQREGITPHSSRGDIIGLPPPDTVRALIFDCGTGETKALLYTYTKGAECNITLVEIKCLKYGVIDQIEAGTWQEGVIKKFSDLYLKATSTLPAHAKLDFCIVGASSWARRLYDDKDITDQKNRLMHELRDGGLFPKIFPQHDESAFELLATLYAFGMAQRTGMVDKTLSFGAVLASGSGSSQFTYMCSKSRGYESINLEIGNRDGQHAFLAATKKDISDGQMHLDVVDTWVKEMTTKIDLALKRKDGGLIKIKGFVLAISAQYYAAVELCATLEGCKDKYGKFANKSDKTVTITVREAIEAAEAYRVQQKRRWLEMSTEERTALSKSKVKRKTLKDWSKGLANVSICLVYWRLYFEPSAVFCFKRDWEFGAEKAKFRNTWSAGWFIDILKSQKLIDLSDNCPPIRQSMEMVGQNNFLRTQRTTDFRLTHSKVAHYVNDMVASHITAIPDMAHRLISVANAKKAQTDPWIFEIEKRITALFPDGTAPKDPEGHPFAKGLGFSVKGQRSLERKLDSRIATLVLVNAPQVGDGSYAPLESEVFRGMRDCLRYTLVIQAEHYYKSVRLVEQYLTEQGCELEGKNYWQNPPDKKDRKTMYMGLNLRVWMAPDPRAEWYKEHRFPVELQIHTPESFELKNGASHLLYEDIRTESVIARRDQLVQSAYALWEDMQVPQDETATPKCFSQYTGLAVDSKPTLHNMFKTYENKKRDRSKCAWCKQPLCPTVSDGSAKKKGLDKLDSLRKIPEV